MPPIPAKIMLIASVLSDGTSSRNKSENTFRFQFCILLISFQLGAGSAALRRLIPSPASHYTAKHLIKQSQRRNLSDSAPTPRPRWQRRRGAHAGLPAPLRSLLKRHCGKIPPHASAEELLSCGLDVILNFAAQLKVLIFGRVHG